MTARRLLGVGRCGRGSLGCFKHRRCLFRRRLLRRRSQGRDGRQARRRGGRLGHGSGHRRRAGDLQHRGRGRFQIHHPGGRIASTIAAVGAASGVTATVQSQQLFDAAGYRVQSFVDRVWRPPRFPATAAVAQGLVATGGVRVTRRVGCRRLGLAQHRKRRNSSHQAGQHQGFARLPAVPACPRRCSIDGGSQSHGDQRLSYQPEAIRESVLRRKSLSTRNNPDDQENRYVRYTGRKSPSLTASDFPLFLL